MVEALLLYVAANMWMVCSVLYHWHRKAAVAGAACLHLMFVSHVSDL